MKIYEHANALHQRGFMVLALLVMLAYLAGFQPDLLWQILTLAILVIITGLPHGAVDPLIARQLRLWKTITGLLLFSFSYLLLALLVIMLWIWQPGLTLASLLLLSVWHFSGDWRDEMPRAICLGISLGVLTLPAITYSDQVNALFAILAPESAALMISGMQYLAPIGMLFMLSAMLTSLASKRMLAVELSVLLLAGLTLPPLLFFLVYFCLLHSPRHLLKAVRGIGARAMLLWSSAFTLLTVLLGWLGYWMLPDIGLQQQLVQLVFIGLLALTVPHMLLNEWASHRYRNTRHAMDH